MSALYRLTDGVELELMDMYDVGRSAGLTDQETDRAVEYLVGEGLVEYAAMGGIVRITHFGVVDVERQEPT